MIVLLLHALAAACGSRGAPARHADWLAVTFVAVLVAIRRVQPEVVGAGRALPVSSIRATDVWVSRRASWVTLGRTRLETLGAIELMA